MPIVIFRDDNRTEQARINKRLEPYPDLGQTPRCEVVTNPTRCITRVYYGSTQARQPEPSANPTDPFNPGDDIYR
jgi:hypothetical protein